MAIRTTRSGEPFRYGSDRISFWIVYSHLANLSLALHTYHVFIQNEKRKYKFIYPFILFRLLFQLSLSKQSNSTKSENGLNLRDAPKYQSKQLAFLFAWIGHSPSEERSQSCHRKNRNRSQMCMVSEVKSRMDKFGLATRL